MFKILIATHNSHKAVELEHFLQSDKVELKTFSDIGYNDEVEEDGKTFEENALIKARVAAKLGYIGIADDSGLCVDCLDGEPGVYSARYAGEPCDDEKNNDKLLNRMNDIADSERTAKFVSVIACVTPDGTEFCCRGECPGIILRERRGNGGFGYDPLFLYQELNKTFAEMNSEEKNSVSHRARAMQLFAKEFSRRILKC